MKSPPGTSTASGRGRRRSRNGSSASARTSSACRRSRPRSDQVPAALCEMEGYWCYWHGGKGYSGVGLHVSKALAPDRPAFSHPAFDYENRIVTVDVRRRRRRDGRVGLRAERRQGLPRQDAVPRGDGRVRRVVQRERRAARALRRPERRAHRPRRAPEGAQAARDRPAAGGARAHRADHRPRPRRRRPRARPRQRRPVHLVGAVAQHARSATSAGASTTCSRATRSPPAPLRARCRRTIGTSDHAPVDGDVSLSGTLITECTKCTKRTKDSGQ